MLLQPMSSMVGIWAAAGRCCSSTSSPCHPACWRAPELRPRGRARQGAALTTLLTPLSILDLVQVADMSVSV